MRTELATLTEVARAADAGARRTPTPDLRSDNASDRAREAVSEKAAIRAEPAAREDPEAVKAALDQANEALAGNSSELAFELDDGSGRVVVKLIDTRTKEVLRQMPTEEMLAVARALQNGESSGALLRTDA